MPNAKRRLDWFKCYPADFFNSHKVLMMTHAERGAYILLLLRSWLEKDCGLPDDDLLLSRLLFMTQDEWQAVAPAVRKNFQVRNGRLYNDRLLLERGLAERSARKIDSTRPRRSPSPLDPPSRNADAYAPAYAGADADRKCTIDKEREGEGELQPQNKKSDLQMQAAFAGSPEGGSGGGNTPSSSPVLFTPIQPWVRKIWEAYTYKKLAYGKRDVEEMTKLIRACGDERIAMLAWHSYVSEDPPKYNLEPVSIAVEQTRKDGKKWIETAENQGSITRFPVLAFIAICQGYVEAARDDLEAGDKAVLRYVAHWLPVKESENE